MKAGVHRNYRMRIIPVLDVLGGCVVRGVGGRRDEYRPIVSKLCNSREPPAVTVFRLENPGPWCWRAGGGDPATGGGPPA